MADSASPPPQKLSRYRSQRKPQQTVDDGYGPLPEAREDTSAQDDGFTRSKSRYRRGVNRPATATQQEQDLPPVWPSKQVTPVKPPTQTSTFTRPQSQRQSGGLKTYHERTISPPAQLGASDAREVSGADIERKDEDQARNLRLGRVGSKPGQEETPERRHTPSSPLGGLLPPPRADVVKPAAKPVVLDGPPTSDQIRATKSTSALPRFDDEDEVAGGCFGLFKRKRGETTPQAEKRTISKSSNGDEPPVIRPGGGGIVPGTDAPVSAVNAGDRVVLLECGKSKMMFPVTPTTTSVDLIKSASVCMNERIDTKSAVLLESFITVGIQRPLRRYEHIRDVLNSWDTDRQNTLLLVDPGTGSSEAELSVTGAPKHKPDDRSWFMSFSQKVGKWDKRYITLHTDGQVTTQKDPDKPRDAMNVCHLSDFDIYTPTQEKARKKIRPPKKLCFAIKSQQKTSMFESTQNFVHFFCTNDRRTADDFYAAIQAWRSWYLVNVMGEGRKPKAQDSSAFEKEVGSGRLPHRPGNAMDSGYQLGSFKPLMDVNITEKRPGTSGSGEAPPPMSSQFTKSSSQFDTTVSPERRTSRARKQNPPGSMSNRAQLADDEPLVNLGRRGSVDRRRPSIDQTNVSPEEFLSTGLLGRSYSQRQKEQVDREDKRAVPFTHGPNLLSNGYENREDEYSGRRSLDLAPKRTHSTRAQHAHKTATSGNIQRSGSRARDMPKPLVDLTPQYREPPQHLKKGRGYNADTFGPGNLIDAATSPEDPIGIPSSTDWRGRNNSVANTTHVRSNSLSRNAPISKSVRRPATSANAFTGEGLLAGSQGQSGWGTGDRGRGIIDGSRARGPMVDLNEPSKFVQGSLLDKAERDHGAIAPPIIDRSREEG